ncbi:MAG: hypothetical protein QW350_04000 [Candidatus Aenigmatarchaeota archaeon]
MEKQKTLEKLVGYGLLNIKENGRISFTKAYANVDKTSPTYAAPRIIWAALSSLPNHKFFTKEGRVYKLTKEGESFLEKSHIKKIDFNDIEKLVKGVTAKEIVEYMKNL